MPSGPKKRRAARKKEGLGIILDKEEKKSQDVTGKSGITSSTQSIGGDNLVVESTAPAAIADGTICGLEDKYGKEDIEVVVQEAELEQNESEVNNFVSVFKKIPVEGSVISTELKKNEAIQDISFDESEKHVVDHVFPSDHISLLINEEEAVLLQSKNVDTKENIDDDDDNNTKVENFVVHVHNAGFNFPSAEVGINDATTVNQDTYKISTETLSEEFPVKDFVNDEIIEDDDSTIKRDNVVGNVNAVSDYLSVFERNNDELVADNMTNLDSFKIHSENLPEEIPVHNGARLDLPTSTFPLLPEEFAPRNETMIPIGPVEEEEQQRMLSLSLDGDKFACSKDPKFLESLGVNSVSSDQESTVDDTCAFEIKKNLKLISELICQSKKILEEELSAVNKFRDIILKSLDDLNAIQLPQVI